MKIEIIPVGPMYVNCIVLHHNKEALVVDPGFDSDKVRAFLDKNGLTPTKILCTHGHFDHIGQAQELKDRYNIPLYLHQADEFYLSFVKEVVAYFGLAEPRMRNTSAEGWLKDNDSIVFGDVTLKVLHTPGHSAGSVGFYIEKYSLLLSGDTLFKNAIGRTNFKNSQPELIAPSIRNRLYTLPDNTNIIPGHGMGTTIGYEKKNNPFVRA